MHVDTRGEGAVIHSSTGEEGVAAGAETAAAVQPSYTTGHSEGRSNEQNKCTIPRNIPSMSGVRVRYMCILLIYI